MKKIALAGKEDNVDSLMSDFIKQGVEKWNEVLRKSIEMYLGRPIDFEKDKGRFEIREQQGDDVKYIFVDGITIGSIKQDIGNYADDFIENKITMVITFIPSRTASDKPPHSS